MSRRITIRLGDEDYGKLQNRCQANNLDASFVVRRALFEYFSKAQTAEKQDKPASTGDPMPPEAFALEGPYRAWSGDLRAELRKRLKDMLALAHSALEQFPRTRGVRETYVAILTAYNHLEGVGHGR